MAENEDPYDLLLVSRSATAAEIRRNYQELARKVKVSTGKIGPFSSTCIMNMLGSVICA